MSSRCIKFTSHERLSYMHSRRSSQDEHSHDTHRDRYPDNAQLLHAHHHRSGVGRTRARSSPGARACRARWTSVRACCSRGGRRAARGSGRVVWTRQEEVARYRASKTSFYRK
ncbi:hypothetical protein BD309DRAFT_953741 [Dichomitus squalens]|nr:hypothetical protein BD309DRAFT_953741 [Dichomitus squalens]